MLARWIFPVAHLVFQLVVCLFFGGSWLFVVVALVFLAVVAFFEFRRRFPFALAFRTLSSDRCGDSFCPRCAAPAAELWRS